jgi:hypothetical protein
LLVGECECGALVELVLSQTLRGGKVEDDKTTCARFLRYPRLRLNAEEDVDPEKPFGQNA